MFRIEREEIRVRIKEEQKTMRSATVFHVDSTYFLLCSALKKLGIVSLPEWLKIEPHRRIGVFIPKHTLQVCAILRSMATVKE